MHWVELNRFACAARHLLFEGDATDGGGERESNFVTFSFFGQRKKTRVQLASRGGFDLRAEGSSLCTPEAAHNSRSAPPPAAHFGEEKKRHMGAFFQGKEISEF